MPRMLLRIEGFVAFGAAIGLYLLQGGGWLMLVALLLVPDVSMAGYLVNQRIGQVTYNLVHTYALPIVVGGVAFFSQLDQIVLVAYIWIAHIGMDRMFGFGLKYPSGFKDTHLSRV